MKHRRRGGGTFRDGRRRFAMRMSQNPSNQTSAGGGPAPDHDAPSLPGAGGRLPLQSSTPARAAPTRGVKVVLLRGGLEGGREREVLDTADMTLDLQPPIHRRPP